MSDQVQSIANELVVLSVVSGGWEVWAIIGEFVVFVVLTIDIGSKSCSTSNLTIFDE